MRAVNLFLYCLYLFQFELKNKLFFTGIDHLIPFVNQGLVRSFSLRFDTSLRGACLFKRRLIFLWNLEKDLFTSELRQVLFQSISRKSVMNLSALKFEWSLTLVLFRGGNSCCCIRIIQASLREMISYIGNNISANNTVFKIICKNIIN